MRLDELSLASTIEFPKPLTLNETRDLLDYLAISLPAEIRTTIEYLEDRYYFPDEKGLRKSRGNLRISGSIKNVNKFTFDCFVSRSLRMYGSSRIDAINFQTIPGYSLEEHGEDVRQLWDDIRNIVNEYFAERK